MYSFALAVFFLLITPGPGVLSVAGVGSGFGRRAGMRYMGGLFIGTNLVALAVISGAAAFVFSYPYLRDGLLFASGAYLLYLALKIAFSGSKIAFIESETAPGIRGGILLQMINPKSYAVNTALFTGFGFWPDDLESEIAVKLVIANMIWVPIHVLWLTAGISLRRLNLGKGTQRFINAAMAVSMLAVVALAALAN